MRQPNPAKSIATLRHRPEQYLQHLVSERDRLLSLIKRKHFDKQPEDRKLKVVRRYNALVEQLARMGIR